MNIQTSNSVSIIAQTLRTCLNTITQDVDKLPEELAADVMQAGINPTGPMMFVYDGISADRKAMFDLRIALPVSQADARRYDGSKTVFRLQPFHYVETVLHGDIAKLDEQAYQPLFSSIHQAGLTVTGYSREVYQNFVEPQDADNETRVQVGVKAA